MKVVEWEVAKISTGDQSQAEITFDDVSGILIEANTEINIIKAKGFNYMCPDGSPGIAVDKLIINLKKGKIFGTLATRYENAGKVMNDKKTQGLSEILLAGNEPTTAENTRWELAPSGPNSH